jgi:adenylate kinase
MPLNVIMLGPPGAGKGTQAGRLAREYGVPKISTGDSLREEVTRGTELGRLAKATMDAGHLVPDDVMVALVRDRLLRPDTASGFVLDGFPRTVPQAMALDKLIQERNHGGLIALQVIVPLDELFRRLYIRRICGLCGSDAAPGTLDDAVCSKCGGEFIHRTDDNEDVVRERLRVFEAQTEPLVAYYANSSPTSTFFKINGNQPLDTVTAQIRAAVDQTQRAAGQGADGTQRVALGRQDVTS